MGKLYENEISPFVITFSGYETSDLRGFSLKQVKVRDSGERSVPAGIPSRKKMAPPTPLASLILPLLDFFRYVGWTHLRVEYDPGTQTFRCISGSLLRKTLCCIIYALSICWLYGVCELMIKDVGVSQSRAFLKILEVSYVVMNAVFFHILLTRGRDFTYVLDSIQRLDTVLRLRGCAFPKCNVTGVGLILVCLILSSAYALESFSMAYHLNESIDFWSYYSERLVKSLINICYSGDDKATLLLNYKIRDNYSSSVVIALAILEYFLAFTSALVWITGIMLLISWGIVFGQIWSSFLNQARGSFCENALEDIRTFDLIAQVLDMFNDAVGPLTLVGCLACITHFSVHGLSILDSNTWWIQKLSVAFGLSYCSSMFLVAANVNSKATKMVKVIRSRLRDYCTCTNERKGKFGEAPPIGTLLLLSDIQTDNIGFKGCGYFTITYSFIGTVISAISTYAVVVLQLKKEV